MPLFIHANIIVPEQRNRFSVSTRRVEVFAELASVALTTIQNLNPKHMLQPGFTQVGSNWEPP